MVDFPNSFEIRSAARTHSLIAPSHHARAHWVNSIHEAIDNVASRPTSAHPYDKAYDGRAPLSASAHENGPIWIPDHKAAQCMLCLVTFRFWRRRHHCRKCGKVVCHDCSTHFEPQGVDPTPVRTCDECKHINPERLRQRRSRSDSGAHASQRKRVYSVILE